MYGFSPTTVVFTSPSFTLWREGSVMGAQLTGFIDDPVSLAWRAALTAEIERGGYPRFLAFDMAESEPRASRETRVQVARYVQALMKHVEWAALHTRRQLLPTSVMQAVRHIVRIPNVTVTHEDQLFANAIVLMRAGKRPE